MGEGFEIKCKHCGYANQFFLGIGMMYPHVYGEVVEEIKTGEYGEAWKQFFDEEPNAAVNCETELYQCPACHELTSEYDLSLYRKVKDNGQPILYWNAGGNKDFQFVKSYVHKCPRCSTRMRKIHGIPESIICPDCGAEIAIEPVSILWD